MVRAPAPTADRAFFGHPKGLAILFFAELWERFSFYGMRALLLLYLTTPLAAGGPGLDAATGTALYALYTSLVYLLGLPGGWLADHRLGQRRAVLIGGILIAAGHFSLALASMTAFYAGLALIVAGTGLLKPNISAIVGQLYAPDDTRRDAGFTIFYMGINFGAFLGPLACAWLGERVDWHLGFAAAGVGMVVGLVVYVGGGRLLGEAGRRPAVDPEVEAAERRQLWIAAAVVGAAAVVLVPLWAAGVIELGIVTIADSFGLVLFLITVAFFGWLFLAGHWTPLERGRLWAVLALFVAASIFWAAYEQAGSSLNLFARDFTDRTIGERAIPAGWFQSVPALFVILLAPVFAWTWTRLGTRQPSSPAKFALGLVLVGAGTLVMVGAALATGDGSRVSPAWLLLTYFLHVTGELCLSPVGLSTVTRLAPERVVGMMMGAWFLASAVGNYVGGRTAGLYETLPLAGLFGAIAGAATLAGLLLFLLVPRIRGWMGGVH